MVPRQKIVGQRIRECRLKANLTQVELAEILQNKYGLLTDRPTISKWETGYQEPTITPLKYMAEIFGESLDYLNGDKRPVKEITRQSLKDEEKILLSLWGEIGDDEKKFLLKQMERAAQERERTGD